MPRPLLGLLCALTTFVVSALASAHDPFEITTSGRIGRDTLSLVMTLSRATALALARGDAGTKRRFEPSEFEELRPELLRAAEGFFELTSNGKQLALREKGVALTRENDVEFTLAFERPTAGPLRLTAGHLRQLSSEYGNLFHLSQDTPPAPLAFELLRPEKDSIEVDVLPAAEGSTPPPAPAAAPAPAHFSRFLGLGVEHILTGYDHLLFLAGLLFACHTLRGMLIVISCFTVAHSITLSLAALNVLTLRPSLVEPLIAASIVVVGVENLLARGEPKGRWAVTLAFGLLHGLGFASVLQDLGVGDGGSAVVPLLAFNLGVELGQLLVAAIVLPLLFRWRRAAGDARAGLAPTSVVVSLLGAYWLIERTVLS